MRAQSLNDLVYKSGQAGVYKASVSLVFDNRVKLDKDGRDVSIHPAGYPPDTCPQITVTRQVRLIRNRKYFLFLLINSHH